MTSTSRAPLATLKLRTRPSATRCTRKRTPTSRASASRKKSAITLSRQQHADPSGTAGGVTDHRVQQRDRADDQDRGHDHALDHALVVALGDERPKSLILAEGGEHDQRERHHPWEASPAPARRSGGPAPEKPFSNLSLKAR